MMRNQPFKNLVNRLSQVNRLGALAVSTLAVGIAGMSLPAIAVPGSRAVTQISAVSAPNASLPNGTYLYGQSPKPDQVGQGYFVFEVNQGKVVGALYMPRSSFDCTSGSFKGEQLALTVVNSYDRSTNPYDIALERNTTVASANGSGADKFSLEGFHRISDISQNDRRILATCKADLQK